MYSEEGDLTYLFHICPTYQNMTLSIQQKPVPLFYYPSSPYISLPLHHSQYL